MAFRAVLAEGEDYGPIFINELQAGASAATQLPRTGAGIAAADDQSVPLALLGLAGASVLLFAAGVRVRRRALPPYGRATGGCLAGRHPATARATLDALAPYVPPSMT